MAESDTILQLGIEAAREGNREEARNLFGLLTRQEPDNVQAWLWLAGVADGPDERRGALERVVELDPTNEMAVKGLQAMGAAPQADGGASVAPRDVAPTAPTAPARALTDEERYAAELDAAFDDYDALPRAAAPPRPASDEPAEDEVISGATTRGGAATSARDRVAARRARSTSSFEDDEDLVPARSGPSPLLWVLLIGVGVLVIGFLLYQLLFGNRGQQTANNQPGGVITPTLELETTAPLTGTGELSDTAVPTETLPLSPTLVPTGIAPSGNPTAPSPGDLAAANPAPAPPGTQLQADGWTFTFPDICGVSCATVYGKQIGNNTAQGTYIVVLVAVANNTGTDQPLPANFFVLKDAQGHIYDPLPPVSSAYLQRGINADISMEDGVPANGGLTSMPLVFDVPSGATNLTLFARSLRDQGWQVLNSVP